MLHPMFAPPTFSRPTTVTFELLFGFSGIFLFPLSLPLIDSSSRVLLTFVPFEVPAFLVGASVEIFTIIRIPFATEELSSWLFAVAGIRSSSPMRLFWRRRGSEFGWRRVNAFWTSRTSSRCFGGGNFVSLIRWVFPLK